MAGKSILKGLSGGLFVVLVLLVSLIGLKGSVNEPAKPTFVKNFALFGADSITISGNTQIYSIGSIADQTEQSDGDIRSNGPINISGSNHLNGNATSGPGYLVTITGGKNQVLGETSSADTALEPQIQLAQDWLAYAQQSNNNASIPSQYLNSNGNLKVTGNKTCTLPAGIYYLNGITLSGSGKVVLEGDAVLTTYGPVALSGNSRLNYNEAPSKCLVVSTASSHTFSGSSKGNFELFSPLADISATGNCEYISNLWTKTVNLGGSAIVKRFVSTVPPAIQVDNPADGSLMNTNIPYIKVSYSDTGSGLDLPSLEIKLDGIVIDYLTVTETQADGTVQQPLSEGPHTITAKIASFYGYFVEAESSFTIDTIAPVITISDPPEGFLTDISSQTIAGSVSEQAALTMNGGAVTLDESLLFSKNVALAEGVNEFVFSATDPAGNSSSLVFHIMLDTVAPIITITSPQDAAVTDNPSLAIIGGVSEQAVLTMNGEGVPLDGSFNYSKSVTLAEGLNEFTFSATDPAGNSSSATLHVTLETGGGGGDLPPDPSEVATPIDPTVPTDIFATTTFLYEGDDPIQMDVAPGTIEAKRVAILRGKTLDFNGEPVSGIKITLLNHPEYGWTLTREDGMFDMAVNGGGQLIISYEKEGYLSVQRHLVTPWRDYMWAEDVIMTQLDPIATPVNLSTSLPMQVAEGSIVSDIDGERQAAILFPTGTTAQMVMPDGSTQSLNTATVRITEYTLGEKGPKAMPAVLPPQSGYTYCVELSADEAIANGADKVQFSQPLIYYVNNFIGFPVGSPVPTGSYDKTKGEWIAEENGLVVKILGYDGGMALLDVTATGVAADAVTLATLGITDEERANIAALYPIAGTELWRVGITHFSPYDCNWPYGPPDDATGPDGGEPQKPKVADDDCQTTGSIISVQSQALGEAFGLAGLPFGIHYQSKRAKDYSSLYAIDIPVSKTNVPASVKRMEIEVEIAGQVSKYAFNPETNLNQYFKWDGADSYGRTVQGAAKATIKVKWIYPAVYKEPYALQKAFSQISSTGFDISGSRQTSEITISKIFSRMLGSNNPTVSSVDCTVGGWTVSVCHLYDSTSRTLYYGNGDLKGVDSITNIIDTTAGGGATEIAEGIPALGANINPSSKMSLDADGSVYFARGVGYPTTIYKIYRISPEGLIYTFAGDGTYGDSGDYGPATSANFKYIRDIASANDGSIYIADNTAHRIRKVLPNGIIVPFAGNGTTTVSGDGGPATAAGLGFNMNSISEGPDGSLYVWANNRARKVTPDGNIITVVGGGTIALSSAEGKLATKVNINTTISAIASSNDGSLYLCSSNYKVYRISSDGIFRTFAGTGVSGTSGDGGPATSAKIESPGAIVLDFNNSRVYIAGADGCASLRFIDSNGIIYTAAGVSSCSSIGDKGPALQASLSYISDLAIGSDGRIYVQNGVNGARIREISFASPGFSQSDIYIPSAEGSQLYRFSSQGRHLQTLNALTSAPIWTFAYDSEGRLISIADAYNNSTTIARDSSGNPTSIVSPFGQITTLTSNTDGYLSSIQAPDGSTTSFIYTAGGLLETFRDSKNQEHTFTYDDKGRLITDANPTGSAVSLEMTEIAAGWSVKVTSAEGHSKTYTITDIATGGERRTSIDEGCTTCSTISEILPNGTTTVTSGDGTISTITEGPDPRLGMIASIPKSFSVVTPGGKTLSGTMTRAVTLSNPSDVMSLTKQIDTLTINGKTFTTTYTASNKTFVTTTPTSRQVTSQIDANGKVLSQSITGIDPISFTYDAKGRTSSLTQGSRTVSLSYDPQGNLSCVTDPLTRTVNFAYDPNGRVTSQTFPDGRSAGFAYDANGNVTSVTPPGKLAHSFTYTPVDLQATYTPPDIGIGPTTTTYSYNGDRQLTSVNRPDNKSIAMAYDGSGRLSSVTTPEGSTSFTYDPAKGQLTSIINPDGITNSYTHDGFLPLKETWAGTVSGNITRTFNNDFQLSAVSVNDGTVIPYTYDNDTLLTSAGALTLARSSSNGLLNSATLGSVTDSYSYNSFGEVTNYTAAYPAGLSCQISYTRDTIGRITGKTEAINGTNTSWEYIYDTAGRLQRTNLNGSLYAEYGYDTNGNRLTKTTQSGSIAATYDAQDRLTAYGNNTYTYTANGELSSKTNTLTSETTAYEYDVLGNLRSVVLPDSTLIDYVIDGRNRRVGKKVNGVLQRQWIYDGQLRPMAELDGTGALVSQFVYATHINIPDYMVKGGTTYRIITDHLGSLRFVIDVSTGTIAQRMDYDNWGNVITNTNADFTPFGFAGGMYDSQTKLVRFGARDYDAEVGRWTAKDPIGFGGGLWNLYSYCGEQPQGSLDPSGLWLGYGHGDLLDAAFGGYGGVLNEGDINIFKDASSYQDSVYGDVEFSYMHEMRAPWQSVQEAETLYNQFLCDQLNSALSARNMGFHDLALSELGKGMHGLMDSTSPSHRGFQVWNRPYGINIPAWRDAGVHLAKETPSPYMSPYSQTEAMRKLWDYFNKYKKGCPCSN